MGNVHVIDFKKELDNIKEEIAKVQVRVVV